MAKSNTKKKSKASATPPAAPRPRASAKAKPKPAKSPASYYLVAAALSCELTDEQPAAGISAQLFPTFDSARLAAIDNLVEMIEVAESQLHALKRATNLSECRAAKS